LAGGLAIFMAMSATLVNVAEFKDKLTEYLAKAEAGEEVVVCRRNVPVVKLEPVAAKPKHVNRTQFGSMKGTVQIFGDLTEPFIPESEWEMLK
jgi:prevent-host-death family protein